MKLLLCMFAMCAVLPLNADIKKDFKSFKEDVEDDLGEIAMELYHMHQYIDHLETRLHDLELKSELRYGKNRYEAAL